MGWDWTSSRRQIMRLLTKGHSAFVEEAQGILHAGLERASWITVDDTGARHKMRERRVIGNDQFAWFSTTGSKSRLNFLERLAAGNTTHLINDAAVAYMPSFAAPALPEGMRARSLSQRVIDLLMADPQKHFADRKAWMAQRTITFRPSGCTPHMATLTAVPEMSCRHKRSCRSALFGEN